MNRAERRSAEKADKEHVETLYEWLRKPDLVARRGEVWTVMGRRIELHELNKRRNRPYARFQRLMNRIFRVKAPQVDETTGDD